MPALQDPIHHVSAPPPPTLYIPKYNRLQRVGVNSHSDHCKLLLLMHSCPAWLVGLWIPNKINSLCSVNVELWAAFVCKRRTFALYDAYWHVFKQTDAKCEQSDMLSCVVLNYVLGFQKVL